MTPSLAVGLIAFSLVTSITPGPNNIMLMSSGATYGFRPTLPHLAGVIFGFGAMMLLVGWGLAGLFAVVPWFEGTIRVVGVIYLLYLAYKIGTARGLSNGTEVTRPITFTQAAIFQWVNPKAWTTAVGAITAYVPADDTFRNATLVALIFTLAGAPCVTMWAAFGVAMRAFLKRPNALRAFNIGMAVLLVLSLYPMVREMI